MNEEFNKSGPNSATSTEGFSVEVKFAGGVFYRDAFGEISIDTEWLQKPSFGMLIYKESHANKGLEGKDQTQINALFDKIIRALKFLGYRVEIS